jgi:hypothetical protein
MKIWKLIKRPPWRTILLVLAILVVMGLAYLAWSPGKSVRDGRHDLRTNGIWSSMAGSEMICGSGGIVGTRRCSETTGGFRNWPTYLPTTV